MLPGASGFDILAHARRQGVLTPVLIASARSDSRDKQRALDLGAIDYITKPFWPQELLDRVAAHLARPEVPARADVIEIGALTIDLASSTSWRRSPAGAARPCPARGCSHRCPTRHPRPERTSSIGTCHW